MQAFGSDRVRVAEDGTIVLSSRISKGWTPRVPKTMTRMERPGTAVLWEDAFYEVLDAEGLPGGGVRYVLDAWQEHHTMRVSERYDAESEALRVEEHRKALARESKRKSVNALAVLTGHLPAIVQQEMAMDLGINPTTLTMISAGPLIVLCGVPVFISFARSFGGYPPLLPVWMLVPMGYLTAESIFRFNLAFLGKPLGSVGGLIAYGLYYLAMPKKKERVSPLAAEKGSAAPIVEAPADVQVMDAFTVREPLITLLTPREQARAAEKFGYDYRRHSFAIAAGILFFAALGLYTSLRGHAILSGLTAGAVAAEQVVRLIAFRRGPAGSVFGVIARPFVRKLLA